MRLICCEKCGKVIGENKPTADGNLAKIYNKDAKVCKSCGGEFCEECYNEMTECFCCGKKIKAKAKRK